MIMNFVYPLSALQAGCDRLWFGLNTLNAGLVIDTNPLYSLSAKNACQLLRVAVLPMNGGRTLKWCKSATKGDLSEPGMVLFLR